ncbi:MAG: 5-formyltetrahydrofolate cyclo-ligase [Rhodothermales bacterium]|nr:5-formyltetrahydrofolate cyclo-ligase [Rhodothermales bacterium]
MTKSDLRARFSNYWREVDASEVARMSASIQARISRIPVWDEVETALLYLPKTHSAEIDLRAFIEELSKSNVRIVLPVVTEFGRSRIAQARIEARLLESYDELILNRWGIPEPVTGQQIDITRVDVAVVPALGGGRNMYRIGHGYGYYDELLAPARCPKICPIPSGCLVESVPFQDHDVPVDYIVTEVETIGAGDAL